MVVAEGIAVMLFAFLLFLVFPEIGLIAKWSEPIVIVLDRKTRDATFQKVRKRKNGVLYTGKRAVIDSGKSFNNQTGMFKIATRKLYIIQKDIPTTLDIIEGKFSHGDIPSQEEFNVAMESNIITDWLKEGGFDWKIILIIMLGLIALVATIGAVA